MADRREDMVMLLFSFGSMFDLFVAAVVAGGRREQLFFCSQ